MKRNRKGVSTIIGAVILVAIVVAAGAIVWGVINTAVDDSLGSGSCSNLLGKFELNPSYTCFEGGNLTFSISRGDVDVDGVLISLSAGGLTESVKFMNGTDQTDIYYYSSGGPDGVASNLPGRNGGRTYIYDLSTDFEDGVDVVEIAPIVDGSQCDAIDSISDIPPCSSLGII